MFKYKLGDIYVKIRFGFKTINNPDTLSIFGARGNLMITNRLKYQKQRVI